MVYSQTDADAMFSGVHPPANPPALPPDSGLKQLWLDYCSTNGIYLPGNATKKVAMEKAKEWHEIRTQMVTTWQPSDPAMSQYVLAATTHGLGLNHIKSFYRFTGVTDMDLLAQLIYEDMRETLKECGFLGLERSKYTRLHTEAVALAKVSTSDDGSKHGKDNGDGVVQKDRGKLVLPDDLPHKPTPLGYEVWRESLKDWYAKSKSKFTEDTMYLALIGRISEGDKKGFQNRYREADDRTLVALMGYLDEIHARDPLKEKAELVKKYRNCQRSGRTFRVYRMDWEEKYHAALSTGRIVENPVQDAYDFIDHAELSDAEKLSHRVELEKAMLVDPNLNELDWVLQWFHALELAHDSVGNDKPRNEGHERKRKNNQQSDSVAAFGGDGKSRGGKGKGGEGKGKGKGKRSRSSSPGGAARFSGSSPQKAKREPCPKGSECSDKSATGGSCKLWHPGEGVSVPTKGGGKGGAAKRAASAPARQKVGGYDRPCPNPDCGKMVFASKLKCFACGRDVPKADVKPGTTR